MIGCPSLVALGWVIRRGFTRELNNRHGHPARPWEKNAEEGGRGALIAAQVLVLMMFARRRTQACTFKDSMYVTRPGRAAFPPWPEFPPP